VRPMRSVPHGVSLLLMCAQAAAAVVHSSAHRCCVGETYTMGLIPMSAKPWYTFDSSTNTFSGFIPSAMDIIAEETGMTITLVQVNLSSAIFENFYYELQNGVYDFGVGSDELDTYFTPEAGLLCGYNRWGQMGHHSVATEHQHTIVVMPAQSCDGQQLKGIVSVTGSLAATFCIDRNGRVWQWGGIGSTAENSPRIILNNSRSAAVACGTLALACISDDVCYVWGDPDRLLKVYLRCSRTLW